MIIAERAQGSPIVILNPVLTHSDRVTPNGDRDFDGDNIINSLEHTIGLDPLDSADAELDYDQDTLI